MFRSLFRKILLCLCTVLMLSGIVKVPASAVTISAQKQLNWYSVALRGDTYYFSAMNVFTPLDGHSMYCLDPTVQGIQGDYTAQPLDEEYRGLTKAQRNRVAELGYFGTGYGGHTGEDWYIATQIAVWKYIQPLINGNSRVKIVDGYDEALEEANNPGTYADASAQWQDKIDTINALADQYEQERTLSIQAYDAEDNPIGSVFYSSDGLTLEARCEVGETITVKGSNDGLKRLIIGQHAYNADVELDGDTLYITPKAAGTHSLQLVSNLVLPEHGKPCIYLCGGFQDVMRSGLDPYRFDIKVEAEEAPAGRLNIVKTLTDYEADKDLTDLSKVRFTLYNADQSEYGTYSPDKDGRLTIENLPLGEYTLKELPSPQAGVIASEEEWPVKLTRDDDSQTVVTADQTIVNDTTKLEISKMDASGEKELEGAHLTLTDENGSVVDEWTSTDKPHRIRGIAPGSYKLAEDLAPLGYSLTSEITFTVEETGEIQPVVMKDEPLKVFALKTDQNGAPLAGARLQLLESVPLDSQEPADGSQYAVGGETLLPLYEWTSTQEAEDISAYTAGGKTYVLHEISAPFGFQKAEDVRFTVNASQTDAQLITMTDQARTMYISAVKKDGQTGELLGRCELTLFKADGSIAVDINGRQCISVTDGVNPVVWEVPYDQTGSYYVKETKQPEGYRINNDPHTAVPDEDIGWALDNPVVITVNDQAAPFRRTGVFNSTPLYTAAAAAALCGLAAVLVFTSKKK